MSEACSNAVVSAAPAPRLLRRLSRSARTRCTSASAARCIVDVDRRVDLEAAFVDAGLAEAADQLAADVFLEEAAVRLFLVERVVQHDFGVAGALERRLVDGVHVAHRLQDDRAALEGALEVDGRRVVRRRLHQPGQHRRFGHVELGRVFAEVAERGRFSAVEARAESRPC